MSACDKCWDDAFIRARLLGGSQVDHYHQLLAERDDDGLHTQPTTHPTPGAESEEQANG